LEKKHNMAEEKDIQPSGAPVVDHDVDHEFDHKRAADRIVNDARLASDKERKMTLMQGIKLYPKAIGWSVLISTCIVMEGYDVCLLNNFFGFPQFKQKYGEQLPDGSWEIPAPWQAGLSNGVIVGEIIGLFLNGWISESIGYRYTVMGCLLMIVGFTAIFFRANGCSLAGSGDSLRYSMGCLPDAYHYIRLRGLPCCSTWILNDIRQLLLGSWSGYWNRRHPLHGQPRR